MDAEPQRNQNVALGQAGVSMAIELTDHKPCILLEMRDGRLLCARIDCVLGFGMIKNQPRVV